MKYIFFINFILMNFNCNADAGWANSAGIESTKAIHDVFVESSITKSGGYELESGIIFDLLSLGRDDKILSDKEMIESFKSVTYGRFGGPVNLLRSNIDFKKISTPDELQNFLKKLKIHVKNSKRLNESIKAFLIGKPLDCQSCKETSDYKILAGSSKTQGLIIFQYMSHYNKKNTQHADALAFDLPSKIESPANEL